MRIIKYAGHHSDRYTYLGNHPPDQDREHWTSLLFQWFRLCLPMQKSWVRCLIGELRPHILWSVPPTPPKNDIEHRWPAWMLPLGTLGSLLPPSAQATTTSFLSLQTSFAFPGILYKWCDSMQFSGICVCVAGFFYSILFFEVLTYCVYVSNLFRLIAEKFHCKRRSQLVHLCSC